MNSGHYTAYCLNRSEELPGDAQWYAFNDDLVQPIADSAVVTEHAYVLLYERRRASPHNVVSYG